MPGVNKDQESDLEGPNGPQTDQQEVTAVRELTQTDRINRRLLVAFLQSMNQIDANASRNNSELSNNSNSASSDDSEWNEEADKHH